MEFDTTSDAFWDEESLGSKLRQVYDVCHGCRRCLNLCPSFNVMFDRIDASESGEVDGLRPADYRRIEDVCYQCKLCYNHCPYTPPHRFDIDFPRLMLRAKAVRARKEGVPLSDRVLADPDRTGRMASKAAPIFNWLNENSLSRVVMEKTLSIHRDFPLPRFVSETFDAWFKKRFGEKAEPAGPVRGKVALFYTCSVNYNLPSTGRATVAVLRRNGQEVVCPPQVCCGMPALDGGDIASFQKNAQANLSGLAAAVDAGYSIVSPGPTCSYVLKKDYPAMVAGEEARKVAENTYDFGEYLGRLGRDGLLDTGFVSPQGRIAYHLPCHLKSQNIGFRSRDLLKMIPGTTVEMIDRCSGVDGTWGMKREYHDMALEVAKPLIEEIRGVGADRVVTDCPLAGLQIERGTGKKPVHPAEILRDAYGIEEDPPVKKLEESDLLDIASYEKVRDERLSAVIEVKKRRRVAVGALVSLMFENRETLRSQIQEIMRAERLVHQDAIEQELNAYNELMPESDELSATLFIEVDDPQGIRDVLDRFIGLDEPGKVVLRFEDGKELPARFEAGHSREDRISAVHFVKFKLDDDAVRVMRRESARVEIAIRHPAYEATAVIPEATRRALAEDFS